MKRKNLPLLLEQLEDRIFLDANPLVDADGGVDPTIDHVADAPVEPVATEPENTEQQVDSDNGDTVPEEAPTEDSVDSTDAQAADSDQQNMADSEDGSADAGNISTADSETEQEAVNLESPVAQEASEGDSTDAQEPDDTQDSLENSGDNSSDAILRTAAATEPVAIDPMVGEDFDFTVTFNNTTGSTVYSPYIDMVLEGGQDGDDTGGFGDDGITFVNATFLGADVEQVVINITQDGQHVMHPWATYNNGDPSVFNNINGYEFQAGDQVVFLRMPFGSFEADQPEAVIQVTAHMGVNADIDQNLAVHTRGGASLGHDPLNNPSIDNPIRNQNPDTQTFAPELITYNKDIILPSVGSDCQEEHDPTYDDVRQWADDPGHTFEVNHQEVPTGPNYPGIYVGTINVADGKTVTGLEMVDTVTDGVVVTGINSVEVNGVATNDYTFNWDDTTHQVTVALDNSVTGGVGDDVVIKYDFYVGDVLDHTSGDFSHIVNDGVVHYSWESTDNHNEDITDGVIVAEVNASGHFSSNSSVDDISHVQSIAIQKVHSLDNDIGAAGYTPGDRVQFTLDFEISDYFGYGDITIDDLLSDGMHLLNGGSFDPVITITERGTDITSNHVLTSTELTTSTNVTDDTLLHFDVSSVVGGNGVLDGGYTDGHAEGATRGTITYWAEIDQNYGNTSTGEINVDQGDILSGGVTIQGEVYDYTNNALNGNLETDQSCDSIDIVTGSVIKDIYAITHQGTTIYSPGNNPHLSPGDTVTYHIHYDMPFSSTEDFKLTDYLPQPVFDVHDPDLDGTDNSWTYDSTLFDGTTNAPAAGWWGYTNLDTYHTVGDSIVTVGAGTGNTLVFDYGAYHDGGDDIAAIDLVFTVTVSSEPFADGMYLTNQVRATEESTQLAQNDADAIVQIVLDEPDLHVIKGVVQTDNDVADTDTPIFTAGDTVDSYFTEPTDANFRFNDSGTTILSSNWLATHDINTDLSNVDGSDSVTMAIVVENTGSSGAFDITLNDALPTGYAAGDVTNIKVTDGSGTELTYTGSLFDGNGITLVNDADGALNAYDDGTTGENILVITYDLNLGDGVYVDQDMVNTVTVTSFASAEGATNFATEGIADSATTHTTNLHMDKILVETEIVNGTNDNSEAVIGELVTYQVTVTMPEGHADTVHVIDTLDEGLTFVELTNIQSSNGNITSSLGNFDTNNFSGSQSGQIVTFDLGDLTNSVNSNDTVETITLTYTAFVNNSAGNHSGTTLDNSAVVDFIDSNGTDHHQSNTDADNTVTVIEPDLDVAKVVDVDGSGTGYGDAGDSVNYTITISHNANSDTDAFDFDFSDTIPAEITGATISQVTDTAGTLGTGDFSLSGNSLTLNGTEDMPMGRVITIEVTGTLAASVTPGTQFDNTANITWQSLGDDNAVPSHVNDGTSNERTGDGTGENDYHESNSATVHVDSASVAKNLVGTEINNSGNTATEAIIGELATYQVVITVPEGNLDSAELVDQLDAGLTFGSIISVVVAGDITTTGGAALTTANITTSTTGDGHEGNAQTVIFDLGDLVNGLNNNAAETITIQYTALVENFDVNDRGDTLNNSALFRYEDAGNNTITTNIDSAQDITILESQITTTKHINNVDDATVAVGDIVTYTVVLENTGNATAYEVTAVDTMAQGTTYFSDGTHVPSATAGGVVITDNGNGTLTITSSTDGWDIDEGGTITVTYYAMIGANYFDQDYTTGANSNNPVNSVNADWSSNDDSGSLTNSGRDRIYNDQVDGNGNPIYTVDGSQDVDTAQFNLNYDGSIGDLVFFDADNSGTNPGGDVGISGVDVTLTADLDGDNIADFTRTVRTDADGLYSFGNLAAFSSYVITVDTATAGGINPMNLTAAGYSQTYDPDGTATANTTTASLTAGEHRTDVDFGYAGQNTVGDVVWWDADADGLQDTNEGGLNGLTVTLHADIDGDGNFEYSTTTTTASHTVGGVTTDGWYSFGDYLPGGDYYIEVAQPAASVQTYDIDGSTTGTSANRGNFTLAADNDRTDIDFGYNGVCSIGNYVWYDINNDGVQDAGEQGLGGVKVTLTGGDLNNDGNPDTYTTFTDNNGSYSFNNLFGSAYTVTIDTTTLPGGDASNWDQSYDLDDSTGAFITANSSGSMDLGINGQGTTRSDVDFGYTGAGSIGDLVFFDADHSGDLSAGDTGITNLGVTLTADLDNDGTVDFTWTTTTDTNGNYTFDHLLDLSLINNNFTGYTVTIDPTNLPPHSVQSYDLDGTTPEHVTTGIALAANEDRTDVDFGYITQGTGSIGDTVWYDADADGVQGASETGLAGVTLQLDGDITGDNVTDVTYTTITDANGNYLFDELLLGTYTVTVIGLPNGMSQTFDLDDGTAPFATPDAATISLADGEHNNNVDFGYTGAANIGNTIYFDADNSGSETGGDVGLGGVTVTLTGDVNNDGIEDVLTTTTDANGNYLFENLRDGDYVVTVDPAGLPGGMSQSADPDAVLDNTSNVTIAAGVDDLGQDFGYTGTGIIGDRIWDDQNGDGVQDGGENGLNGVDVTLSVDFDGDGVVDYTETVTTAGDGDYSFSNLPAGNYTIKVDTADIPGGYILTGDPDSNPDSVSTVVLPAGGTNLDQDFGYQDSGTPTGSIGDTIYYDADHSGSETGNDLGLGGVTVTLTGDIDGDGDIDTVTTTTAADGTYLFDNLVAGDYTVTVDPSTLPAGMLNTVDPDGGNDNSADVTIGGALPLDNTGQDFGYDGTGSIGDTIYFDGNNNGNQDSGDVGIGGVDVRLDMDLDGDGNTDYTQTATTQSDGSYLFEDLPAGEYTITVDPTTLPNAIQQSADPDSSLDNTSTVNLAGGQTNLDQDFGYTGTGSIGDTIWNDVDGDGTQNGTEEGLSNVDITLNADIDGDGNPDYTVTVTTDSNGNYVFENLPAGDYTITVDPGTLPTGMNPVADPDGGNDNTAAVTLVAGEDNVDQDFGYNSGTGSIGDTIFFDEDGNGAQNGTEGGLAGVSVTLVGDINGDGTVDTLTAITDSNGKYLFENLAAGNYTVTVDQSSLPAGMNQTSADPDTPGAPDNMSTVALAAGADNFGQDFGYRGTGSIGDTIWDDADGNGIQNGAEVGMAGVDVTLSVDYDGDGNTDYTMMTTTGPGGSYSFDNLPAGEYTIEVDTTDIPANYTQTGDPDANPDSTSTVNLAVGETNNDQDFGYHDSGSPTGSIGDFIWFDSNGNGLQDEVVAGGDSGLGGVTVTLTGDIDGDGDIDTITTTTADDGSYLFDNLNAAGAGGVDYTITVDPTTLPGGMIQTGDPDSIMDNTTTVNIGGSNPVDNDTADFGYNGTGTIGDTIYFDTDGDGVEDPGENGMGGVDVSISVDLDGDGIPDYTETVTTAPDGSYSFNHLPEGEYTVTVDPATLPNDVAASGDPDSVLDNSTTVNFGSGETNNDQDFGYTGTGSIGDTIYSDVDGNGFQSSGEPGIGGVTVTLQGDFDNDGTIDSVTTTTDANGHYLFEGLTAGTYTVYVDSTTLPPGLTQTGDPDASIDDQSTVILGAGEANNDQDFGYNGRIVVPPQPDPPKPEPVIPPAPAPTPVIPVQPQPDAPAVVMTAPQIIPDAFFMHQQFGDRIDDDIFQYPFGVTPWLEPILPVSPIYSGLAEPGTTLNFVLYDALGNEIANQTVMADTAGNWLASFPGVLMFDQPHHMVIEQTSSTYNASSDGFFNMRTYYNPNFNSMAFSSTRLDVAAVFAHLPSTVMESMHASNMSTLNLGWDDFNGYEFFTPSTHPASSGH